MPVDYTLIERLVYYSYGNAPIPKNQRQQCAVTKDMRKVWNRIDREAKKRKINEVLALAPA